MKTRWIALGVVAAGALAGGCSKQCDITCVTATATSCAPQLVQTTRSVDLDVSSDSAGRSQCIDEAEKGNGTYTACWGYYR